MKKTLALLSLLTVLLQACTHASENDLVDSEPLPTLVTYNDDVKMIIDNNCISCHKNQAVNGASVPLVTYANVKSAIQNNNLISKINGNGPGGLMPQGGPKLPQSLIDIIEKWETDGFLEN